MDTATLLQRRPTKVSVELLAPEHYRILDRALRNVLSTDLDELTMAQLVDGLPLASSGCRARGSLIIRGHPLLQHGSLCDGALEQTKAFREAFDPSILRFDSTVRTTALDYAETEELTDGLQVMQAYQDADIGSLEFKYRLVELVAVAIHQIAVLLFQLQPKLHNGDIESVVAWKKEARWVTLEGGRRIFEEPLFEPGPTLFFHIEYMDYDQYPNGVADIAGYWAEDQIFGGVVLFDRGVSGLEVRYPALL